MATQLKKVNSIKINNQIIYVYDDDFNIANSAKSVEEIKSMGIKVLTNLEYNRLSLGLTRKKLSELSGVNEKTIEAYELKFRDENLMSVQILKQLYLAMNIKTINLTQI